MRYSSKTAGPRFAGLALAALAGWAVLTPFAHGDGPGVHGRVLAIDDQKQIEGPVAGAAIEFRSQAGKAVASTKSNSDGYYKVDLPPGNYLYVIKATGFKDEDVGRGLTLKLSEGYAVYNFTLVKGKTDPKAKPPLVPVEIGTLQGQVFERLPNGDFVGIPGARVVLRRDGKAAWFDVVCRLHDQKSQGQYEITLEAGAYHASAMAEGFETFVDPKVIEITTGKTTTRHFTLARKKLEPPTEQGIRGHITIRGLEGTPPPVRLVIRALPPMGQIIATFGPDGQGNYQRELALGRYTVTALAEGYQTASSGPADVFAGKFTVVNLTLVRTKTEPGKKDLYLVGKVFERLPGGKGRLPLADATVLARLQGKPLSSALRSTTDSEGKIRFQLADAGKYEVLARKAGFVPAGARVEVTPTGANTFEIELTREVVTATDALLKVHVVETRDMEASAVLGAKVVIQQGNQTVMEGVTNRLGDFGVRLAAGNYEVDVIKEGFVTKHTLVKMAAKDAEIQVVLVRSVVPDPVATLELSIVERVAAELRAVPRAAIVITQLGRVVASGESDGVGHKDFRLAAGQYEIEVRKAGFLTLQAKVALAGKDLNRQLILTREKRPTDVALELNIVERVGNTIKPISGADVAITRQGQIIARGEADNLGRYTIKLPPGEIAVAVTEKGFEAAALQLTLGDMDVTRQVILKRKVLPPAESQLTLHVQYKDVRSERILGIPGAQISIFRNDVVVSQGQSGPDAQFNAKLLPGNYRVDVSKQGFESVRMVINVTDAMTHRDIFLSRKELPPADVQLTVHVQVKDQRLERLIGIPGAQVSVFRDSTVVAQGQTGTNAQFSAQLPAGSYRVEVSKQGFGSVRMVIAVTEPTNHRDIVLLRAK